MKYHLITNKLLCNMKVMILFLLITFLLTGCRMLEENPPVIVEEPGVLEESSDQTTVQNPGLIDSYNNSTTIDPGEEAVSNEVFSFIYPEGSTIESRINTPKGYARIPSESEEFAGYLRTLSLKEHGSDVLLYTGTPKGSQDGHVAVFDLDVGERDLQQCADSLIRIYAEYYWSQGAFDKISFHLTNGFLMEYTKWRDGNRIVVEGNDVRWVKSKDYDASYKNFRSYLDMVYAYAGTLSLSAECKPISIEEVKPGDLFLQGGSPGHCVLVIDIAENSEGERCFLLAQGYMPAQDFHVLKNPLHSEDPWYYASELTYPLETPSWTFHQNSLVRFADFDINTSQKPLVFSEKSRSDPNSSIGQNVVPVMSSNVITASSEEPKQVTILAVGDNLIHLEVIKSGLKDDGSYNFDHLYSNLIDEISSADIAIINQETILGGEEFAYTGYPNFNSPTEIGDSIVKAGFDVVLHATNHTMDKGLKAVENTFDFWSQYPDMKILGINRTEMDRDEIPIIEKNGIKLAMLNYTYSLNGHKLPKGMSYLVNMLDRKQMKKDIEQAEKLADFTIVFPHWGTEYVYEATNAQKELTKFFYNEGVDLVIGTHPHVLEPVEWIQSEEKHRMLVYYSLGNFMSYQKEAPRMLGGLADITITKDETGTYISNSGITPILTHYENGPSGYNYGIYKLSDYSETMAMVHGVSDLSEQGPLTYSGSIDLAKHILGLWYH